MANILDLPDDVFEIIFKYLVKLAAQRLESQVFRLSASIAAELRLVCRKWANWLYVHHLYHTLTFTDTCTSLAFINQITTRPESLPRARCQKLNVCELWIHPPYNIPHQPGDGTLSPFETLNRLILLFSDTIVELDLEFVSIFSIPPRTIELIGQIENLSLLRLGLDSEAIFGKVRHQINWRNSILASDSPLIHDGDQRMVESDSNHSPHHPHSFLSLLFAAQGLTTLVLSELPSYCLPKIFTSSLVGHQLPQIIQLELKLVDHQPLESLINLVIALKSSIKVLSVRSFREDTQKLVPIFEHLRDRLEGLFVTHESTLTPIHHFKFPNLRVFRIFYWQDCLGDFLSQDMFTYAPIEVIAVYSHTVFRRKRKFLIDPFAKLTKLRRLAFLHARLDDSPPQTYLDICKSHRVECVYLDHSDISAIMKL